MNICEICNYSTNIKCNFTRHRSTRHKTCDINTTVKKSAPIAKEATSKQCKPKQKITGQYAVLLGLIDELKIELNNLTTRVNYLMSQSHTPETDVSIPIMEEVGPSAKITSEYLTETFTSAPNIEFVIAQIGSCNRDLFEPIDKIEDDEELIATLHLSYKGTQLIFDNGDPFSWSTAYFIDDIDDFLEKCKQGKDIFYLKLFTNAVEQQGNKCFYYDEIDDMYWVKSKNKWNTFWTTEVRTLRVDIVDAINKYGYNIIRYSKCGLIESSKDDVSCLLTELKKCVDCKLFENAIFSFFKSS